MTAAAAPAPVAEQLRRLAQMEVSVAQRLDQIANGVSAEQLARMRSLARQHHATLEQLAETRGIRLSAGTGQGDEPASAPDGAGLEQGVTAAAGLASGYAALYATARLLFEGEICEVANRHGSEWVAELKAASKLLPVAIIHELVAKGEECRCMCPACGIGACLCERNSVDTLRAQWGEPAGEPSEGIELRIPPRAGSQLADAGLQHGDRVLAIDGEVVHDNRELQQALRGGAIGERRTALVIQGGSQTEISVVRVSELT